LQDLPVLGIEHRRDQENSVSVVAGIDLGGTDFGLAEFELDDPAQALC
jgi:hypothetical protein